MSLGRELIANMDAWGASDLFLDQGRPPSVRVKGKLRRISYPPITHEQMEEVLRDLMMPGDRERFEASGELDFSYRMESGERFRVNLSRQRGELALVIRAIHRGSLSWDELGLPEGMKSIVQARRGLFLVAGATGSGKSTTMASVVHAINESRLCHIVTIEDPVEYEHADLRSRVTQREVGRDTRDFSSALRHVLRQSPDVICIGELRDLDTVQVALSASLSGHLVLATLHTTDVVQTLQKVVSFYPPMQHRQVMQNLAMCLQGVLCQRLLPSLQESQQVLAVELMMKSPAVSKLIREERMEELYDLLRNNHSPKMFTFNRALLDLFLQDRISYEQALQQSSNPDELALAAQGMRTGVSGLGAGQDVSSGDLDMKGLLQVVQDLGASDLHLTVGRPPILRVQGKLDPMSLRPLSSGDMRRLLYSILTTRQRSLYELEQELDFALSLEDGQRFRVNAYFQSGKMAAALRAIPAQAPNASRLGLPEEVLRLGDQPQGLLLVVGPTGAGKTTTMACLLDRINHQRACRIITIEDPIEYSYEGDKATIDQREVYADTRNFASALKFILRQDPDVIMVGEMRDIETISAALTAAETGHLVMATLHSNDAIQTIDRIIDSFPSQQQAQARSQLAACLLGVVSQRLLPKKGSKQRVAAFEVLLATPGMRNLIRENKMHQAASLMDAGRMHGMISLDRSLSDLYKAGVIEYDDALRYIRNARVLGAPPGS